MSANQELADLFGQFQRAVMHQAPGLTEGTAPPTSVELAQAIRRIDGLGEHADKKALELAHPGYSDAEFKAEVDRRVAEGPVPSFVAGSAAKLLGAAYSGVLNPYADATSKTYADMIQYPMDDMSLSWLEARFKRRYEGKAGWRDVSVRMAVANSSKTGIRSSIPRGLGYIQCWHHGESYHFKGPHDGAGAVAKWTLWREIFRVLKKKYDAGELQTKTQLSETSDAGLNSPRHRVLCQSSLSVE